MSDATPSITCPRCGRTSYHPVDVQERYCGACRAWHADLRADRGGALRVRRITATEIVAASGLTAEKFRQRTAETLEWNAARYDPARHWMAHLWDNVALWVALHCLDGAVNTVPPRLVWPIREFPPIGVW
jgi:ribosomal protein L37E